MALGIIPSLGSLSLFGQEPDYSINRSTPLFQRPKSVLSKSLETPPSSAANPGDIPTSKTLANQFQPSSELNVARVIFIGTKRFDRARLLNEISTREGQPYSAEKVREDVRKLDGTHRYLVGVRADEQMTPEGAVITFYVVERSTLSDVVYQGARHATQEELDQATGLRRYMPMSVSLNRLAAQRIEQMYRMKGRLFAQVNLLEGEKEEDNRVVFQITEGPEVKVAKLRVIGANFISARRLGINTDLKTDDGGFLGFPVRLFADKYQPQMLDTDINRITEWYKSFGFFDVKVKKMVTPTDEQSGVNVDIIIEEGPRYYVREVQVAGTKRIDKDIILAHNTLKPNQPFTAKDLAPGMKAMHDEYGNRGIINTQIRPDFTFHEEPGVVTVVYRVEEGPPPARIGEIQVVGNTITREEIARRELARAGVLPGQLISVPDLKLAERYLARLRLFKFDPQKGVQPRISILDPESPNAVKNLLVEVEEDATGLFQVGASIGADAGINAQITMWERNFDITRLPTSWDDFWTGKAFRGGGQDFRITAQPGTEVSSYSVSWREPYLFDSNYSLDVSGYYFNRFFIEDHEQRLGANIGIGRRLDNAWSFRVGAKVENIKIGSVFASSPPDYLNVLGNNFLVAPQISVNRDTRDDLLVPTEGSNLTLTLSYGLGDYQYPTVTMEGSKYFTMYERPDGSGRHVLMFRGIVGWSGDDTPVYDRFFAGGSRSLRGFSFRGVGPIANGYRIGGNFQALGTVEYRVPLMANDKLAAVAFSDFGTVESDVSLDNFRLTVGGGLRISLPISPAPIAIDWGFPILKADFDQKQVFQFYVSVAY